MTSELPLEPNHDEEATNLSNIQLPRRQQLQNRLQFLKEIQKKNHREGPIENEDGPSELEKIQEELKALEENDKTVPKKVQFVKTLSGDGKVPNQGLYILPIAALEDPEQPEPLDLCVLPPEVQVTPEETVDLDDVTMCPAKVKCPSCHSIVNTEIRYKVGSNSFLFCCILSVVGCLAGCCLVPFFLNRFKDVSHQCPSCKKQICIVSRI